MKESFRNNCRHLSNITLFFSLKQFKTMAKKTIIEFELQNAVKLVPLTGKTSVKVTTTGDVLINDPAPSAVPRVRSIKIAETQFGCLSVSPGGMNTTVKIILPTEMASKENFLLEVHALFDQMKLEEIEMERNLW